MNDEWQNPRRGHSGGTSGHDAPAPAFITHDSSLITSAQNPRVKRVARLVKSRRDRDAAGQFVAEGEREVGRALAAGLHLIECYAPADAGPLPPALIAHHSSLITSVSAPVMRRMSYRDTPPAVLAVFETPRRTLADLPKPAAGDLILVAVGTEKPGNLGAMARTAAAAGCSALIAAGADVDVWNPNCLRNSAGAVFSLPTVAATETDALDWLAGTTKLAAVAGGDETGVDSLWDAVSFPYPLAVLVGPEHAGLPRPWLDAADVRVTIPLAGGAVDSLNASVAAAIVLFELDRRRRRT